MSANGNGNICEIDRLLSNMEKINASDLHLKGGSAPIYRIHSFPRRIDAPPVTPERLNDLVFEVISKEVDKEKLIETGSVDFAHSIEGVGRFRVNIFRQRGNYSFCARRVNNTIPNLENLGLPKALNRIPSFESGMALVVGATGSGKSTTLASILQSINEKRRCHILTIEDPIEYVYQDVKAFINQREVGLDVPGFNIGLKYAMREDPDVILVGEMRDTDTIETALAAAETGHLVFATLHANNATQTLTRILDFFTGERQPQIRQMMALTLRSVLAQKLLPGCTKEMPRVPAAELMFINAVIKKMIQDSEDHKIGEAIRSFAKHGMMDFNMSLYRLVQEKLVTEEVALDHSPNPEQLGMQFRGMVLNEDQSAMGA